MNELKKYNKRVVILKKRVILNEYTPCVCVVLRLDDEEVLSTFYAPTLDEIIQLIKLAFPNDLLWIGELKEDLPNDLIYDESTDFVRKMTDKERIELKKEKLETGEKLVGDSIVRFDAIYEYVDNEGNVIKKSREQLITEKVITLESERDKARQERKRVFEALDLYDKAVLRGDIIESEEGKKSRDEFRIAWLELPNNYADITKPIESLYPEMPQVIKYFDI